MKVRQICLCSTAILLASATLSSPALAQGAPAGPPATSTAPPVAADDAAKEIVVTGSHIGRTSFNSPIPVNVVGQQRMQDLAIPNVGDALNQLPSFRAATTASTILFRVSGSIGGNSPDLRGLGATRTLTLVDGRRFVPSTDNGTVDLNGIPSALVQRSEIVTGGASAAYGADAVAGVVNLILDTKFNGLKTDTSGGISQHGDAKNASGSIAFGHDFAGGRGHYIVGLEGQWSGGVGRCETRDYCKRYENYIPNPGYIGGVSTNGLPATIVSPNVVFVNNAQGILIGAVQTVGGVSTTLGQQVNNTGATALPAALRGLQFNGAGNGLIPYQFGSLLSGQFMIGGDPSSQTELWGFGAVPLLTPTWHVSAMAHADYDLTDNIKLSGEFMYSHVAGGPVKGSDLTESPVGGSVGVNINNPYITPAVRAQILAANPNITAINVYVAKPEAYGPQTQARSRNDIYRGMLALKGNLFKDWGWDLSYTHGETRSYVYAFPVRLKTIDGEAAAAITPPAGYTGPVYTTPAGAPVICSSSVASPTNGCIPVNFFGLNSISQAALQKYYITEWQTRTIKQDAVAANLHGSVIHLPAGDVKAAAGVEYRRDTAVGNTDAFTLAALVSNPQTTALPFTKRTVFEGYLEGSVPLLADLPFVKSLTVDGSVRRTHYNSFGNATTWKVGGEYSINDNIMFRVTKSHDIRQPTAAETNPNTTSILLPIADPFGGGTHNIANISGGNAKLALETADTMTVGAVLRPSFMPRFRLSIDYYKIQVDGAIDTLSGPNILNLCFQQNQQCNLIQFSGAFKASPAAVVFSNFQNLSKVQARGLEIVGDYTIPDVLNGSVNLALNANYVFRLISVSPTGAITRFDGVTGNAGSLTTVLGVPSFKIDGIITYARPTWSISTHMRYIPKSILDPTKIGPDQIGYNVNAANSVNINKVSPAFYMDLSGTIKTGIHIVGEQRVEIYGAINNLFDKYPPEQLRFFGNPLHYDVVGRSFRLGVRTKW